MAVRIICIKKDDDISNNPYLAIGYFEWINERINVKGITDRCRIHDWVTDGNEAYIIGAEGNRKLLIPAVCPEGNKYVRTVDNEADIDELLLLPQCDENYSY